MPFPETPSGSAPSQGRNSLITKSPYVSAQNEWAQHNYYNISPQTVTPGPGLDQSYLATHTSLKIKPHPIGASTPRDQSKERRSCAGNNTGDSYSSSQTRLLPRHPSRRNSLLEPVDDIPVSGKRVIDSLTARCPPFSKRRPPTPPPRIPAVRSPDEDSVFTYSPPPLDQPEWEQYYYYPGDTQSVTPGHAMGDSYFATHSSPSLGLRRQRQTEFADPQQPPPSARPPSVKDSMGGFNLQPPPKSAVGPWRESYMQADPRSAATSDRDAYIQTSPESAATSDRDAYIQTSPESAATSDRYAYIQTSPESAATSDRYAYIQTSPESAATSGRDAYIQTSPESAATSDRYAYIQTSPESAATSDRYAYIQTSPESAATSGRDAYIQTSPESPATTATPKPAGRHRVSVDYGHIYRFVRNSPVPNPQMPGYVDPDWLEQKKRRIPYVKLSELGDPELYSELRNDPSPNKCAVFEAYQQRYRKKKKQCCNTFTDHTFKDKQGHVIRTSTPQISTTRFGVASVAPIWKVDTSNRFYNSQNSSLFDSTGNSSSESIMSKINKFERGYLSEELESTPVRKKIVIDYSKIPPPDYSKKIKHKLPAPVKPIDLVHILNSRTYTSFIKREDLVVVMFHNSATDQPGTVDSLKKHSLKAPSGVNPLFASVDCAREQMLCASEGINTTPFYKMYSGGYLINTVKEFGLLNY